MIISTPLVLIKDKDNRIGAARVGAGSARGSGAFYNVRMDGQCAQGMYA